MRLLITTGGTREPIDDVRFVGNAATGRTGSLIAEEAVRRFHTVHLASGTGSLSPADWVGDSGLLVQRTFGSAADLADLVERWLSQYDFDAIVAAAAVADFSPTPAPGKLSSSGEKLVVTMKPVPKVLDRMRELAPEAMLVAFKLESGISRDELFARARAVMSRSSANLVVANDAAGMGKGGHAAWILGPGDEVESTENRDLLACRLLDLIEERALR